MNIKNSLLVISALFALSVYSNYSHSTEVVTAKPTPHCTNPRPANQPPESVGKNQQPGIWYQDSKTCVWNYEWYDMSPNKTTIIVTTKHKIPHSF